MSIDILRYAVWILHQRFANCSSQPFFCSCVYRGLNEPVMAKLGPSVLTGIKE